MTVVLFAALAGALFGVLALTVRWGLGRPGVDAEAGALPLMCTAVVVVGIGAAIEGGPRPRWRSVAVCALGSARPGGVPDPLHHRRA